MYSTSHVVRERFTFLDFYSVHDEGDESGDIERSKHRRSSSLPAAFTTGRDVELAAKQQELAHAHGLAQCTSMLSESSTRRPDNAFAFDEECFEVDAKDADTVAIKSRTPSDCCDNSSTKDCCENSSTKATSEASQEPASGHEITSVMIRNIPCSLTKKQFIDLLVDYGFSGTFDFVHLPGYRNKRRGNIGYGFVNFIDRKYADAATELITGHRFSGTLSKKVAIVSPAVKNLCGKWSDGSACASSHQSCAGAKGTNPPDTNEKINRIDTDSVSSAPHPGAQSSDINYAHTYVVVPSDASSMPMWCPGAQDGQQVERWCSGTSPSGKKKPFSSRREQCKQPCHHKSGAPTRETENRAALRS